MTTTKEHRERLTRERIVEAALRVMDAEGLDAVTMRRVAREVGVEAMSLYHHVRDKDDLLGGICSLVMRGFVIPPADLDPAERARLGAHEWRRLLKAHPNVVAVFAERKEAMTDIEALLPMEFALDVLRSNGLEERDAVQAFNVIGGYIMGCVMMEVGRMFSAGATPSNEASVAPPPDLPADRLPCIVAALPYLAACDPDEQFDYGLDLLLAGIAARVGENTGA